MAASKYREASKYGAIVTDGSNECGDDECRAACDEAYGGKLVAESVEPTLRRRIVALLNACERIPTEALEELLAKTPDASQRIAACINACSTWGISTDSLEAAERREKWLVCMTPKPGMRPEDAIPGYDKLAAKVSR